MTTIEKGNLSEAKFTARLLELGYEVLLPFGGNNRYDLVFYKDGFKTVQVKTGKLVNGVIRFNSCSNNKGQQRKSYHGQVDYIGVYCLDNKECYLVPVEITGTSVTTLRITLPKNNQKVNLALNYKL